MGSLAEFDGKIEGLMLYRIMGEEVTKYNFIAYRFYYLTSRARYLLLSWLARHVDQALWAEIWLTDDEYPETWWADTQVKVESSIRAAMCRVVDVEKIAGMDVGEGSFSARIIDPLCPWNECYWHFGSYDGKLEVTRTSKADCDLSIQGLTALIAGMHDPQDISLHGWCKTEAEVQSNQGGLFPRTNPFMHDIF